MKYEFKPFFDRSVKSLPSDTKQEVKELCITLIDVLTGERELSAGMGLKKSEEEFLGNPKRTKTADSIPLASGSGRICIGWDSRRDQEISKKVISKIILCSEAEH